MPGIRVSFEGTDDGVDVGCEQKKEVKNTMRFGPKIWVDDRYHLAQDERERGDISAEKGESSALGVLRLVIQKDCPD